MNRKETVCVRKLRLPPVGLLVLTLAVAALASATVVGCGDNSGAKGLGVRMNNLRQLGETIREYMVNSGQHKSPGSLQELVDLDLAEPDVIVCPATGKPYVFIPHTTTIRADEIVACEVETSGGDRVCLFGDGKARPLSDEEFNERIENPKPGYGAAFAKAFRDAGGK
jgi:hypothetical protein